MMNKKCSGFSLIEIMITVAIIGILAAVAIPLYSSNVMKSQMNRVLSEVGAYKSAFEVQLAKGGSVANSDLGYVPSDLTTGNVMTDVGVANGDGSGHIEVTMGGRAHPNLSGVVVQILRDTNGRWMCTIDVSSASGWQNNYRPDGCTVL